MKKPFVSLQTQLNFSQVFFRVLEYHLAEHATILDPTPGEKHSWQYYLTEMEMADVAFFPITKFNPIYINDDISNFDLSKQHVQEHGKVDAVFYDPPYIFGHKRSTDVRREDYGDYHYTMGEVKRWIEHANTVFPSLLKENGLLFFKHTDVFSLNDRKFYFCSALWNQVLSNFRAKDHYIVQHHHISPTAWQVKDRPCGIVNYTYLTVYEREG